MLLKSQRRDGEAEVNRKKGRGRRKTKPTKLRDPIFSLIKDQRARDLAKEFPETFLVVREDGGYEDDEEEFLLTVGLSTVWGC